MYNTIRAKLDAANALLITSPVNRRYLTGFAASDGWLLITADAAHFITDSRYIEAAEKTVKGAGTVVQLHCPKTGADVVTLLQSLVSGSDVKTLGFEDEYTTVAQMSGLKKQFSGCEFLGCSQLLTNLRSVKSEAEIAAIGAAQALTDEVFSELLPLIKPGVTEKRIAAELTYLFLLKGADGLSFDPIVASGVNGSMPHAVPTDREFKRGDFVTLDFGCVLNGYCSDMTRTVAVGDSTDITDEQRRVYDVILAAQSAGIAAVKAGVLGKDVHNAAAVLISDAGYGDYFGHGFGHGVGLEVHETPNASPRNDKPLPANAVISAEPGVYLPGKLGVRIEDLVVVRESGAENLTKSTKQLVFCS